MGQGFNSPRLHHFGELSRVRCMFLAVYGSLLRAEGMLTQLGVADRVRFAGGAQLPGRLFDLGDYPGLLIGGDSTGKSPDGQTSVPGELFEVLDPVVWTILDDYEGFDSRAPDQSPFVRRELTLVSPALSAWVYVLNRSAADCPEVVGMSWPEYKARRREKS